jgi:hypothetical protein
MNPHPGDGMIRANESLPLSIMPTADAARSMPAALIARARFAFMGELSKLKSLLRFSFEPSTPDEQDVFCIAAISRQKTRA